MGKKSSRYNRLRIRWKIRKILHNPHLKHKKTLHGKKVQDQYLKNKQNPT